MKTITERALRAENVSLGYGTKPIVENLSQEFPQGKVTAIIGPNGYGKSTLLRGVSRMLKPLGGHFTLDEKPTTTYFMKGFARMVGLMSQHPIAPEGITVADLVSSGRYPYQGIFKRNSAEDDEAVACVLEATNTMSLAQRQVTELSGGQCQRVWIVMALAQETDIVLLDEPTTYLDLAHQVELLDLICDLNERRGTTMIMVLHELNLAARVADYLVAMKEGSIVSTGTADEVLTAENLHTIFGLRAQVADPFDDGSMVVVPHPSANTGWDATRSAEEPAATVQLTEAGR